MFPVVILLLFPPAVRLVNRPAHRIGDLISVHDHLSMHVPCCPANGLDQGRIGTQESFLIRIQDRHQRYFGQVQSFTQQVDPDDHIEYPKAQVTQNSDPFQCFDFGMKILDLDPHFQQVIRQVLRHALW